MHRVWLISAALGALMLPAGPALAQLAGAPRVIDGDTLEVAGQRVRLFGIDAPEIDQLCQHAGRDYACGQVARATLWDLIAGRDVDCTPEDTAPAADGSIRATCSVGETSLNERMVHAGWALADADAPESYRAAQAEAEQTRRGLWRGQFEAPWEWREAHAGSAAAADPPSR